MSEELEDFLASIQDLEQLDIAVYAATLALDGVRELGYTESEPCAIPITVKQIDQYRVSQLMCARERLHNSTTYSNLPTLGLTIPPVNLGADDE